MSGRQAPRVMDALKTYHSPMSGSHTIFLPGLHVQRVFIAFHNFQDCTFHVPKLLFLHVRAQRIACQAARTMCQVCSYHIVRVPRISCRFCTCYLSGLHVTYVRASRTTCHGCLYHMLGSHASRVGIARATCQGCI